MPDRTVQVVIRNGRAKFVYSDDLHKTLGKLGTVKIERASNVEFDHARGGWMADMAPTCPGEVLGPFESRTEALAAEKARIEERLRESDVLD